MAQAALLLPRSVKPADFVRVNLAHPQAKDIAAFLLHVGGGTFYDAVTQGRGATAAGQKARATSEGNALDYDGATTTQNLNFRNPNAVDENHTTVIARMRLLVKPTVNFGCPAVVYGSTVSGRGSFVGFSTAGYPTGGTFASNGAAYNGLAADKTNQWVTVGGCHHPTATGTGQCWVNGVYVGQGSQGADTNVKTANQIRLGRDQSGYNSFFTGDIAWAVCFNRILTDDEHGWWYDHPFEVLEQARNVSFFSLPAGSGGVIISSDGAMPIALAAALRRDGTAPISTATALREDVPSPLATGASLLRDGQIPDAWLATLQEDGRAPIAFAETLSRDGVMPTESATTLARDGQVPEAWSTMLRRDTALPATWQATVTLDGMAPEAVLAMLTRDASLPVEWKGAIAVTIDGVMPMAFSAGLARDAVGPVSTRTQIARDGNAPLASGTSIVIDGRVLEAFGAGLASDGKALVAWLATLLQDGEIEIEFSGVNVLVKPSLARVLGAGKARRWTLGEGKARNWVLGGDKVRNWVLGPSTRKR